MSKIFCKKTFHKFYTSSQILGFKYEAIYEGDNFDHGVL
jgi:hypothetical protein